MKCLQSGLAVLVVVDDYLAVVDVRREAWSVLALELTKVFLPHELAGEVVGEQPNTFAIPEDAVDLLAVRAGSPRRQAALGMRAAIATGSCFRPELFARDSINANEESLFLRGGLEEDLALDDDGRGMPATGQGRLPQNVLLRPLHRDALVRRDSRSVGAAEAHPVGARKKRGRQEGGQGRNQAKISSRIVSLRV